MCRSHFEYSLTRNVSEVHVQEEAEVDIFA